MDYAIISLVAALICLLSSETNADIQNKVNPLGFLSKYGYLTVGRSSYGNTSKLVVAIKKFQSYADLNQTGVIDLATLQKMSSRRCGLPDFKPSDKKSAKSKWNYNDLKYRISKFSNVISMDLIRSAFQRAFTLWANVTPLTFTSTRSTDEDIVLSFEVGNHGDGDPFDGRGGTLAHASYPPTGDIHFDDEERWTDGMPVGTNLLWVAAHEIGHALGLGHSPDKNAIMYAYYRSYKQDLNLTQTDINDIQALYGGPPCEDTISFCSHYKTIGYCTIYPAGMELKCKKTCGFCI